MEMESTEPKFSFSVPEMYFITARLVVIVGLAVYLASALGSVTQPVLAWGLISGMLLHLGLYWWVASSRRSFLPNFNRVTFFLDIASTSLFCVVTGGLFSPFYVLFFFTVSYAALTLPMAEAFVFAFLATFLYLILNLNQLGKVFMGALFFRLGTIWFLACLVSVLGKQYRENEARLRKTLNTLSQRNQEQEHSGNQIETIYETTRSLAQLMTLEQIIDKILSIVQQTLGYKNFSILILSGDKAALELKAKIEGGKTIRFEQTQRFNLSGVWGEVVKSAASERIIDVQSDPREILREKRDTRSQLSVPMVVGDTVYGILNAESNQVGHFLDRDQKILSIISSHAALAIENAQLHNKTKDLTITDELTGAQNFRSFKQKLEEEFRRAKRYSQNLSIIMMDLDGFKKVNDTHGHPFGNVVLHELVRICNLCIRDVDVLFRYGGEEFAVILPQTTKEDAKQIAERIRTTFGTHLNEMDKIHVRVTVSLGVATFPEDASGPEELIEKVDQALYQAKGHGKNQVWVCQPLVPTQ